MFTGVHQFRYAGRVTSYAEAQQVLEKYRHTPKRRLRERKAYGYHLGTSCNYGVTWVRDEIDESIAFRLYDTDVVSWSPDNSVTIKNWGSATTSDFARQFLPPGISLRHETRNGGDTGITFCTTHDGNWRDHSICFGSSVTFEQADDGIWLPQQDTCDVFALPGPVNKQAARKLSERYRMRDFDNWLAMAPRHINLEHDHWHRETCLAALEARDFRTATVHLPLVKVPEGFGLADRMKPLPITTRHWQECVTMASLAKLKLAMWADEGILTTVSQRVLPLVDYERCMRRVREMRALGIRTWE